jgi:hypothetical protein
MNKVSEVAVLSVLIQTYIWIWELHKTQLTWVGGMEPPATIYSNRTHSRVGSRLSRTTVWMWLQCLFVLLSHPMPSTRRVTFRHHCLIFSECTASPFCLLPITFLPTFSTNVALFRCIREVRFKYRIGDSLSWGFATSSSVFPGKCRDAVSS